MQQGMMGHGDAMNGASTMEDAMIMCDEHVETMGSMMDMVEMTMGGAGCV